MSLAVSPMYVIKSRVRVEVFVIVGLACFIVEELQAEVTDRHVVVEAFEIFSFDLCLFLG